MNKTDPKHIDLNYLKEMSDGDTELIREMIDIFITEVPTYLSLMKEHHQKEDWDALGKLAHKAKASASIIGMKQLTNELKNLELLAKEKKEAGLYSSRILSIENQFNSAIEELKRVSKTL